ncbi:hypothetical protein [Pseudomonas putida]|uniref:hypothetical protein n=1 Tax=Pseudomonas TaxID=286 RepID=UPI001074B466|nr:hypothetical protein [Pseudomonas putida]MCG3646519.1 hypothetical protein [Pseudomonas putida]MDD2076805.1 hypothetical protein [Pseudomonas putida]TFW19251.1 hypothetical protein E4L40_24135 [Pseudomonas putida]HDS1693017.1 hypothetical protein [Pseudomonas putida]
MREIRRKAEVYSGFRRLTQAQHDQLKSDGAANVGLWKETTGDVGAWVVQFKSEVKQHYYHRQSMKCCYCSKELDAHKGSYDAEHILDKNGHPQFMFYCENIAAVCKTCNGSKSDKPVLEPGVSVASFPGDTGHYMLVHPHHDEWGDYLEFDVIGRIVAKPHSPKGGNTIRICGINFLNAARLAGHFLPGDSEVAEKNLESFFRLTMKAYKLKRIEVLKAMAEQFDLAQAKAIIDVLEREV